MEKAFYSIIEFAFRVGMHPNTIRRAIKFKRISALQIGGGRNSAFRIPASEIHRIAQIDLERIIDEEVIRRINELKK